MRYIVFLFSLLAVACQQKVATPVATDEAIFFDLSSFLQQEIETLQKEVTILKKTAIISGQVETKELQKINFAQELSQFISADINKATWRDQYQADSMLTEDGHLVSIHYTALNDNLRTKKLIVSFDSGRVKEIEIVKNIDNIAVQSHQVLRYFPGKGYHISNEQSLILSAPQLAEVKVEYGFQ